MPLFHINDGVLKIAKPINFKLEKDIQNLIENNLETVFNCKFIVSEFSTGVQHAGRIDTLALSEDNSPVIIEYKKVESSELINQSLYYLSWINDHKGDFQMAVNKVIKKPVDIDWSDIRVICIAPGFKKYDLHAVKMLGISIELWQYRMFDNSNLYIEEIFRKSTSLSDDLANDTNGKNPVMVAAGKKAALTRANSTYTFEQQIKNLNDKVKNILFDLRDYILNLDESIKEVPKKYYIAYKSTQNFICIETLSKKKLTLFLKIDLKQFPKLPPNVRDVTKIGHVGTGNFELTLKENSNIDDAKEYIKMSFEQVGG